MEEEEGRNRKEGTEWLLFVTFIVLGDHNLDGPMDDDIPEISANILLSYALDNLGKERQNFTSSFRCMHLIRIRKEEELVRP